MIDLKLNRKNKKIGFDLDIIGRPYVDEIFEIKPMPLYKNDTLEVSVNLDINGYIDGRLTSTHKEKYRYLFVPKHDLTNICFIRFTKVQGNAHIQVFETMPKNIRTFKKYNAVLVENHD